MKLKNIRYSRPTTVPGRPADSRGEETGELLSPGSPWVMVGKSIVWGGHIAGAEIVDVDAVSSGGAPGAAGRTSKA